MAQSTSFLFLTVFLMMLGGDAQAVALPSSDEGGLAEKVINVVTASDLSRLEKIETAEQQKDFQPRLKELLVDSSLPKNRAKIQFLELKKTPWYLKLWAVLISEVKDESTYTYDLT